MDEVNTPFETAYDDASQHEIANTNTVTQVMNSHGPRTPDGPRTRSRTRSDARRRDGRRARGGGRARGGRRARGGGRRRRPRGEAMTPEEIELCKKRRDQSKKAAYEQSTTDNYKNYVKKINMYYVTEHSELCNLDEGVIDLVKFDEAISTEDGMKTQAQNFGIFIASLLHYRLQNPDNTPMAARLGTKSSYRSAFGWYIWSRRNEAIPLEWNSQLKQQFRGLKKLENKRKQRGLLPMKEGKDKMTPALFKEIGEFFLKEGLVCDHFNHTAQWNLMCRHMNVADITVSALGWTVDCISMQFGRTKNTEGDQTPIVKHVYANPLKPEVR